MANTTNLVMPLMSAAQSQKHLTHNDAIVKLDVLVQLSVLNTTLTTPPGSPADGNRYIVGSAPTGAWTGKGLNVAYYSNGVWQFAVPRPGWQAYDIPNNVLLVWTGAAWIDLAAAGGFAKTGGTNVWSASNTFTDTLFTLRDNADPTKKANFELSGITTATTCLYTLPNVAGALASLGNLAQTFTGAMTFSGTFVVSAASASLGTSTAASTINVGTGATLTATAKSVNIGTGGVSGSTTTLVFGSSVVGSLGSMTFQGPTFNFNGQLGAASTFNLMAHVNATGIAKTINIGTGGASGSTTNVEVGSATAGALGTTTFNSPTVTFSSINNTINFIGTTILAGSSTDARLLYMGLGGATADATNRLSLNTPAALFNNAGTSISLTLNKNATANNAAFTLQTAFSSRALYGLLGDDHFTIKTSPNGSTYKIGLIISKDTAAVQLVEHPKFSVYCNFGNTYAAGWLDMLANIARHNDQGDVAIASNVATFTAPHDGYYMFGAGATLETGGAPTAWQLGISVNNATPASDTISNSDGDAAFVTGESGMTTTALLKLTAGQTVKAKLNITGGGRVIADRNYFWGCQIA